MARAAVLVRRTFGDIILSVTFSARQPCPNSRPERIGNLFARRHQPSLNVGSPPTILSLVFVTTIFGSVTL